MNSRPLGDTEMVVSEIGFPLRPLATDDYGHVTEQDALNLLSRAFDMGITHFDAADSYSEGYAERVLARALGRSRHDITVSTKAGYDFYRPTPDPDERGRSQRWTPGFIQYACEQSLRRLDTDYIDLFQLHHPSPDQIEDDELFGRLDDLVQAGKIRAYGVALDARPESEETGEGAIDVRRAAALQTAFGILDQQPGRRLIARAQGTPTSIIAYDPTASGAMENFNRTESASPSASGRARLASYEARSSERRAFVAALREFGADVGTWAIKFALASPTVAAVLPAITDYAQLLDLARIAEAPPMPREFFERAFEVYDEGVGG